MSSSLVPQTQSRTAMIVVLVVAIGMLIGAISVFTKAYNLVSAEASAKPAATTPEKPGEPPAEQATSFSLSDAVSRAATMPWFWWCLLNGMSLLALGSLLLFRQSKSSTTAALVEEDRLWSKLAYFAMFSLLGFFTVAALAIPYTWMNSSEVLSRSGWASKDNLTPWWIIAGYVLGLGSMFASLLAIRSEERNSAGLRRWIYGYNAFLGALLFLAILGIINAFAALYGPDPSDWTSTSMYSISPATKRLVKSLEKPVTAYVLLEPDTTVEADIMNTLNACKKLSDQLEVKQIALVMQNSKVINELIKKYEVLSGSPLGVLLVQEPNSETPLITHLKQEDLEEFTPGMGPNSSGQRVYKGETAIYNALRDFRSEKKQLSVYFTQDSGEFTLDEAAARASRNPQGSRSLVMVKRKLEKAGYAVKPLKLSEQELGSDKAPSVPDDALAVIVVDPLRMTPEKLKVLEEYLKRPKKDGVEPGRLICCINPRFDKDGKATASGMEPLLTEYGVIVGQDVLYSLLGRDLSRDPTQAMVVPFRELGTDSELADTLDNLISRASFDVLFKECRSIKPVTQNLNYDVKGLLFAFSPLLVQGPTGRRSAVWSETVNHPNPVEYIRGLQQAGELLKKDFF
ncbi:MAG TPA: Gldg family protein, partial [Gemmatales bacterium]|nr:Gldg family protein [Gemmatales bacterium]